MYICRLLQLTNIGYSQNHNFFFRNNNFTFIYLILFTLLFIYFFLLIYFHRYAVELLFQPWKLLVIFVLVYMSAFVYLYTWTYGAYVYSVYVWTYECKKSHLKRSVHNVYMHILAKYMCTYSIFRGKNKLKT